MKTPQQIKNSCNICFISYLGIIAIIFALLLSGCAGTYYVHDKPDTYYHYNQTDYWWWNVNKSIYTQKHYIIVKPNKPNKPNKKRSHRK
jgi:hypothetical protein